MTTEWPTGPFFSTLVTGVHGGGTVKTLLVTAFAPAATGNGSAMRAHAWRRALERLGPTHVLMVPVAGMPVPSGIHGIALPCAEERAAGAVQLATDPRWRRILAAADPVPASVRVAPPWLGRRVVTDLPFVPDVVVAFKAGVAPVALDLAWAVGAPVVLDLDDDEVALERSLGHEDRAAAAERLRAALAPHVAALCCASPEEARQLSTLLDRAVDVVPNTVTVPDAPLDRATSPPPSPPTAPTALFVGNLNYEPNADGVRWFVRDVVPLLKADVRVVVVGAGGREALGTLDDPRVIVLGAVPELITHYRAAALVVCPLLTGSGTRLKILEALAFACPVVSTTAGAAGLALGPGRHLLVADDPRDFATAVDALLADRERGAALGLAGRAEIVRAHAPEVGDAAVARLLRDWIP